WIQRWALGTRRRTDRPGRRGRRRVDRTGRVTVFGRRKRHEVQPSEDEQSGPVQGEQDSPAAPAADGAADGSAGAGADGGSAASGAAPEADGTGSPEDRSAVEDEEEDAQDRSDGPFDETEVEGLDELAAESRVLDLGSVLIPVPEGGQ